MAHQVTHNLGYARLSGLGGTAWLTAALTIPAPGSLDLHDLAQQKRSLAESGAICRLRRSSYSALGRPIIGAQSCRTNNRYAIKHCTMKRSSQQALAVGAAAGALAFLAAKRRGISLRKWLRVQAEIAHIVVRNTTKDGNWRWSFKRTALPGLAGTR